MKLINCILSYLGATYLAWKAYDRVVSYSPTMSSNFTIMGEDIVNGIHAVALLVAALILTLIGTASWLSHQLDTLIEHLESSTQPPSSESD